MTLFIIYFFAVWRILLFLAAYIGSLILPFNPRFPYSDIYLLPSGLPSWIWSFANFDGVHYLTIALQGYSFQFTQVFFPLFPLLLGILERGFKFLPPLSVSLIFSNLLFLPALIIFNKLLSLDYKKPEIKWILIFLFLFPASFFFGSLYTEGLFLLLSLSSLYFARKKRWIIASIFAGLASATRFVGIFLLPALLWERYMSNDQSPKSKDKFKIINFLTSPVLYIAPLGLITYMVYLQVNFGDFLYFWHAQPVFGAAREGSAIILLPQVLWRYFKILTTVPVSLLSFWIPLTELIATVSGIFLLIRSHRQKIRTSYLLYAWPAFILPTLTGTLSSMPRYVLIIFPIFISLGLIKSKLFKSLLLITFLLLLILFTILFTRGLWVA